jgi:phosphopantothenoylcysteine synthetase/decarboxylase
MTGDPRPSAADRLTVVCTGSSGALDFVGHLAGWRAMLTAPITVVLTSAALTFVNPTAVGLIADEVILPGAAGVNPIGIAKHSRLLVVCPATANFLVSAALGLASSPALTVALAMAGPMVLFPQMNDVMWQAETTRSAVRTLRGRGCVVVSPQPATVLTLWNREFGDGHAMPPPKRTADIVGDLWRRATDEASDAA